MKFKLSVNVTIQILALVGQLLNGVLDVVPAEKKIYVAFAIMMVQGIVGILAHQVNADGTPQTQAYVSKREVIALPAPLPGTTETVTTTTVTEVSTPEDPQS
jgi:hypothetical protein